MVRSILEESRTAYSKQLLWSLLLLQIGRAYKKSVYNVHLHKKLSRSADAVIQLTKVSFVALETEGSSSPLQSNTVWFPFCENSIHITSLQS